MYSFEKLATWQEARLITKTIYETTSTFPEEEKFGLVSQLRRASVSICSNIAEGSTRSSAKDQTRFYLITFGSLVEVVNQLILSNDLGFLTTEKLAEMRSQLDILGKKITKLIQYNQGRMG